MKLAFNLDRKSAAVTVTRINTGRVFHNFERNKAGCFQSANTNKWSNCVHLTIPRNILRVISAID